jgi:hypothetical protein
MAKRNPEHNRHLVEAVDRDRLVAAFYLADELAAKRRSFTQLVLIETTLLAQRAETLPEELSDVGDGTITPDVSS